MNVLKPYLRITLQTLLRTGTPQREIERRTGGRKTIRSYARAMANSPGVATGSSEVGAQIPPPRPPAPQSDLTSVAPVRRVRAGRIASRRTV